MSHEKSHASNHPELSSQQNQGSMLDPFPSLRVGSGNETNTYVEDHMIAELAEPRIGGNVPRPFPRVCGGGWERD